MTLVLRLFALLPRGWLQALGLLVGRLNWWLGTGAAKVTLANLRLCFPQMPEAEVRALAKQSLAETGKALMEMPAIWLGATARIDRWIAKVHGERLLKQALASGKGVLMLLPHLGGWELFNVFFRRYGGFTGLYHPPHTAALRRLMAKVRLHHGNEVVATDAAGLRRLYKALAAGGAVVVLPDQVPGQGRFAPFFRQAALTDELAHRLVSRTGAIPLGICILRQPDGAFAVHLLPVKAMGASADASLLAVNKMVERMVALAPAQYQWEYKRFRKRPAGEPKLYRFGKPAETHS